MANAMSSSKNVKKQIAMSNKLPLQKKKNITMKQAIAFWSTPGTTFKKTFFILMAIPTLPRMNASAVAQIISLKNNIKRNQITAITRSEEIDGFIFLANSEIKNSLTRDGRCIAISSELITALQDPIKRMVEFNFNDRQKEFNKPGYIELKLINEAIQMNNGNLLQSVLSPSSLETANLLNLLYSIENTKKIMNPVYVKDQTNEMGNTTPTHREQEFEIRTKEMQIVNNELSRLTTQTPQDQNGKPNGL
ncbi:hypothetical protein GINT2_001847 [Glugoides intestinalis]